MDYYASYPYTEHKNPHLRFLLPHNGNLVGLDFHEEGVGVFFSDFREVFPGGVETVFHSYDILVYRTVVEDKRLVSHEGLVGRLEKVGAGEYLDAVSYV